MALRCYGGFSFERSSSADFAVRCRRWVPVGVMCSHPSGERRLGLFLEARPNTRAADAARTLATELLATEDPDGFGSRTRELVREDLRRC